MRMHNKGKTDMLGKTFLFLGIGVLAIFLLSQIGVNLPFVKQQAVPGGTTGAPTGGTGVTTVVTSGDSTTIRAKTNNMATDTAQQTGTPKLYVWCGKQDGVTKDTNSLVTAIGGDSLSSTATVNVVSSVGNWCDAIAFINANGATSGFYGVLDESNPSLSPITDETVTLTLQGWNTTTQATPQFIVFDRNGQVNASNYGYNGVVNASISVKANQEDFWDKIEFVNNDTDKTMNVALITFDDLASTRNITDLNVPSLSKIPNPLLNTNYTNVDWAFELPQPVLLKEFDRWDTGQVRVKAGTNACQGEHIIMNVHDKAYDLTNSGGLAYTYEDDSDQHTDVGAPNWKIMLTCTP